MQKKYIIVMFALMITIGISGLSFAKKAVKKEKKVDSLSQCDSSGKTKDDPESWSSCCKSHGGKIKGKDWSCDEEMAKKPEGSEEDEYIPPSEEEGLPKDSDE